MGEDVVNDFERGRLPPTCPRAGLVMMRRRRLRAVGMVSEIWAIRVNNRARRLSPAPSVQDMAKIPWEQQGDKAKENGERHGSKDGQQKTRSSLARPDH